MLEEIPCERDSPGRSADGPIAIGKNHSRHEIRDLLEIRFSAEEASAGFLSFRVLSHRVADEVDAEEPNTEERIEDERWSIGRDVDHDREAGEEKQDREPEQRRLLLQCLTVQESSVL